MGLFSGITKSLFGGSDSSSKSSGQGVNYSTNAPWEQQAPYLQQGYATAADLYANGPSTIAPFSDVTQMGMANIMNTALTGSDALNSANNFATAMNSGAFMVDPSMGFAGLNQIASGPQMMNLTGPAALDFDALTSGGGGGGGSIGTFRDVNATNAHLSDVQSGNYLIENPYMTGMYNAAARDMSKNFTDTVTPTLNATFGMGGRTGSGIHAASLGNANYNLANELSDLAANLYGDWYKFERGQQDSAATSLLGADLESQKANQSGDLTKMGYQKDININAANNATSINNAKLNAAIQQRAQDIDVMKSNQNAFTNAIQQMLGASSNITDNYFTGLNQMLDSAQLSPELAAADYMAGEKLLEIGGMIDTKAQQLATNPYDMLNWYLSAIGSPVMTSDAYGYDQNSSKSKSDSQNGIFSSIPLFGA